MLREIEFREKKVGNEYGFTELLSDKSLEAINRVVKIIGGSCYKRTRELKKRDKTFNFFKKLMRQKTGVKI